MDGSASGGGKVFGHFTEEAHRVLDLSREEAGRFGHRYVGPEQGAAGPLLAVLGIDLDQVVNAVTAELGGVQG